ncbi:Imm5 family immunity protein, partial [Pseudomonas savastanoi]|uniref:Imm5 family immunity protein n=1 Tax=Pseudomonas savastanoi TaxID=29438 RepID=UPI00210B99B5
GLLALAGILGVGEGHLFHHRKARRLVSGDFAKLGSLFQSFPSYLVASAFAGGLSEDGDPKLRRAFWEWYLSIAVPQIV